MAAAGVMFVYIPGDIVHVVVIVPVDADPLHVRLREQALVLGMPRYLLRPAGAAHMLVQADHRIGPGHHQVQVVRHHQHPAAGLVADVIDQLEHLALADDIHPLGGLVQHQKVRPIE